MAPQSWSTDGQTLLSLEFVGGQTDIKIVSGAEMEVEGLIETEAPDFYPEVSPDGRWVAYGSQESGQSEVCVRPFPNVEDGRWQITRDGGSEPVWSPDGRELFFRGGVARDMMVVGVDSEPSFSAGNPELLFAAPYLRSAWGRNRPWDVAADGRFLMIKESANTQESQLAPQIVIVENCSRNSPGASRFPSNGTTLGPFGHRQDRRRRHGAGGIGEVYRFRGTLLSSASCA